MTGISGITVLGDLLRPRPDGLPGGVDNQINWLFHAVRRQVMAAASVPVHVLTAAGVPGPVAPHPGQALPAAMAEWARTFHTAPTAVEALLLAQLQDQFCIGYELPPYLVDLLDRNGIGYIDLRVHPVRFMDDLMFAARASEPSAQAWLLTHAVPEIDATVTAGLREAMLRLVNPSTLPENTLLVLGQQRWDSSQIAGATFFDPASARVELQALCDHHAHVRIKAHPYGNDGPLVQMIRQIRPDAVAISDNVYRLLASPRLCTVLSVNSSVAEEAVFFDKTTIYLAPKPIEVAWRGEAHALTRHASIDDIFLSADFWRGVLAPSMPVTPLDGTRLPAKPNRLRLALSAFWNYQEIDSDLVPRTPLPGPGRIGIRRLRTASRALAASVAAAVTSFL